MRKLWIGLLILNVLAACAGNVNGGTASIATAEVASPQPYQTASPTPTATLLPPLTTITLPTTTPIIYTIAKGDTLSGIAEKFRLPVDALMAANPGIQAGALVVGKTLIIPTGIQATGVPIPTPAALPLTQARCWPEISGGLWCFVLVENDYAETVENISVRFTLLGPDGQELAGQTAYGLLDILPGGKSMPLAVNFPSPVNAGVQVRAQILTAVRLLPGDKRYLPATVENTLVSLDADGRTAQVSGEAVLSGEGTAAKLWILAAAFDAAGDVVSLRRWESVSALTAAAPLKFEFQVSSVGPAIERVDFLAEARP